jgi:hypothetical protein
VSTLTAAVVEVVATLAFMAAFGTVAGLAGMLVVRVLPRHLTRWMSPPEPPAVRRGRESPVEVYLRKQKADARSWGEGDR